ncbi:hypothetical protein ACHAWU_002690 [Discostella pseudostelligera]|uniref:VWFA domain-containing protein n=1 Tax=Discostella pseudostelligera TaxID=259834 RepID=A0ABD3MWQ5_9STRA
MMTSLLPIFFFAIATRQFLRARAIILDEDIDAVKVIFDHFATVAKDLRDEIELVYKERCDYGTLSDCDRNNYNDCSSEFPNPQCFDEENFNLTSSECECGINWDTTITKVTFPKAQLSTSDLVENPSDPEVTETACYTRLVETKMVSIYSESENYWEKYEVSDKIAIVTFSDKATVLTLASNNNMEELIIASDENKEELKDKIDSLEADGTTNFYDAFEEGFGLLNASFTNETFAASGTGCNVAIIFLTDGAIAEIKQGAELQEETEKVINLVQTRIEELEANFTRKATIFAYSLGDESDREVMKQIACNTGGIWTHISDDNKDNLISVMGAYYQWFAAGLGAGEGNENFVAWVEPYIFSSDGKLGTSVSVPVYDRTVYPYVFLGVVGVDIYMDAISKIMKVNATEATDWMKNEWIIRDDECPSIVPTECQLEALRSRGGANATCGRCSRFEDILPMPCSTQTMSVYSNGLWVNVDYQGQEYDEKACCNKCSDDIPDPPPDPVEEKEKKAMIVSIAVAASVLAVGLIAALIYRYRNREEVKEVEEVEEVEEEEVEEGVLNVSDPPTLDELRRRFNIIKASTLSDGTATS